MIRTDDSGPYPNDDRLPNAIIMTAIRTVDFFRLQPSSSSKVDTALSVSAIELVTAANSTRRKNKIPAAVATSTRQERGEKVLQMSGVCEYFTVFVYGDTQKASKPKPDIFWNAAKEIGVDPKECLVVEDSTPGVMAGIAAGGATIFIRDMVDVPAEVLENVSASLEDLGKIVGWLEKVNYSENV